MDDQPDEPMVPGSSYVYSTLDSTLDGTLDSLVLR